MKAKLQKNICWVTIYNQPSMVKKKKKKVLETH